MTKELDSWKPELKSWKSIKEEPVQLDLNLETKHVTRGSDGIVT